MPDPHHQSLTADQSDGLRRLKPPKMTRSTETGSQERAPASHARPVEDFDATAGLQLLLAVEAETRRAEKLSDLHLLIANETRKLTNARQIFVFQHTSGLRMTAISGMPKMDRKTPLIQDIEGVLEDADVIHAGSEPQRLDLASYPFPCLLWQPMCRRDGTLVGGFLLARESEWSDQDFAIISRLGETYAYAHAAIASAAQPSHWMERLSAGKSKWLIGAVSACLLAMAIPVPMSVLAPLEVVAHKPFIVAAPIDGAINEILVNPGDAVQEGQPLVRLGGTEQNSKLDVAKQKVQVAEATLKKANQLALQADEGRNELRLAMADLNLKRAELKFAQDMFDRSVIRAERSGVAVVSDVQALIGKPVVTGERIMQIADPAQVEIRIQVPVRDSVVLKPNARVKVFLDSDPVRSREGKVIFSDYQALPVQGDQLAFRVMAQLTDNGDAKPRLGVHGTAQIYGETTFLGLYLFRRPLTAVRQWIGL